MAVSYILCRVLLQKTRDPVCYRNTRDAISVESIKKVFFKDTFNESQILDLKSAIESDERIHSVKYVSKEDAFNIFKELNKNEQFASKTGVSCDLTVIKGTKNKQEVE